MNIFKKLFKFFRRKPVQKVNYNLIFPCFHPIVINGKAFNCCRCVNCRKVMKMIKNEIVIK